MNKNEMLKQVIEVLEQVVELLYQENITIAYKMLYIILPNLEKVISNTGSKAIQQELKEKLEEALSAMENADNILLADIIHYEVLQRLQDYV